MRYLLLYYTGTFNTRYVTNNLKARLLEEHIEVDTYEINPLKIEKLDLSKYDVIGLGYPIYGFNTPKPFLKFVKRQTFLKDQKVFIYKNSGETYHANDASSVKLLRKIKKDKAKVTNEYHFMMPYNIHFRFDELLVKEILEMDELLLDILVKEITSNIQNIKKYKFIHKIVSFFVRLQYIGGPINSFFYKVDKKKCVDCGKCIKECPVNNIYKDKNGRIKLHHQCLMCMRCSLYCPKDAFKIGLFNSWRVNKPYNFEEIKQLEKKNPVITKDTKGFFKCYIETYENIRKRHEELFG